MFILKQDDWVRIERSPYINGHFYLKFKNADGRIMTLGFGYDEPFLENDIVLSNPIVAQTRMFTTAIVPVSNKWVVYHNDHPRNGKMVPNMYHIVTNWFNVSLETSHIVNKIISGDEEVNGLFELPFCVFTVENSSNSCRTIVIDVIKDSLNIGGIKILKKYFHGNPTMNDIKEGCISFEVLNRNVKLKKKHPCMWVFNSECCQSVVMETRVLRCPVCL